MTSWGSTSSLTLTALATHATRCAKRHVLILSSICLRSGFMVAIMEVLQLPPSESRRTDVIIELRYGMCSLSLPLDRSCSATMTISRKCRLLLMYLLSLSSSPPALVLYTRSDPARSTRCSLDRRMMSVPTLVAVMKTVKMQWEREEASFMGVSDVCRVVSPRNSRFSASSSVVAGCAERLRRWMLPSSSSSSDTLGRSSSALVFSSALGSRRS
mmetsp:Transcript_42841/g.114654  ORF Transcript_42841/g.114654 Transcript_42841/m.114654 type:complete len:214 (-) Transcript_42841:600-1241(-)